MGGDSDDAEWQMLFGAKVKTPVDMPDDILKDIITVSTQTLSECESLEANGKKRTQRVLSLSSSLSKSNSREIKTILNPSILQI
jgi:hypothetical protein